MGGMAGEKERWGVMEVPTWVSDAIEEKIQKLEAENARLREALQHIADHDEGLDSYFMNVARKALKVRSSGGPRGG
jgi:predicted nuclease with TOPRIM domain